MKANRKPLLWLGPGLPDSEVGGLGPGVPDSEVALALGCLLGKVFGGFWMVWRVLKGVEGLEGLEGLEGFGGFRVWSVWGLANGSFESQ